MGIIFPCEILQALKINKFYEEWHKCSQQKISFKLNPSSRKLSLIHETANYCIFLFPCIGFVIVSECSRHLNKVFAIYIFFFF